MKLEKLILKRNYGAGLLYGVILFENPEYLEIMELRDFEFEGYQVIAKHAIAERMIVSRADFYRKVIEKENKYKKYLNPIKFETLEDLIKQIVEAEKYIILEKRAGSFYLGPIVEIDSKFVKIQTISTQGRNDTIEKIKLDSIFSVVWRNKYLNRFEKYANKL
ncbi:hypothetical protein [Leptospira wolffii]|nr:hypothetical protein [Leptospira wolffii]